MNIIDIITKKKNKLELSYDEMSYAFNGYLNSRIPDYQMSSLLMAIVINGMSIEETINLTDIFIKSGDTYKLDEEMDFVVDKHSTGGVGDSTTIIIGPMCASLGLKMAKMSGRGLGITGGTIDKLESIPGFNVNLSKKEFINQVKTLGFAISAQTDNLVPMDKVIYALRDVTGTCESIPLIASSIMSKKIALGASNILIDVKYGTGALCKTIEEAEELSNYLIKIGGHFNKNVRTVLSDMNRPLSNAIGNAIEVEEAIRILQGKRGRLYEACIDIVANLLSMAKNMSYEDAKEKAIESIDTGTAYKEFTDFVIAQGGHIFDLNVSKKIVPVKANCHGIIKNIDAYGVARLSSLLGSSKETLDDEIDYSVGVYLCKEVGDEINPGDILLKMYVGNKEPNLKKEDFDFITVVSK